MSTTWLPGANVRDLSRFVTNGPFRTFLGVILHVNVAENGTPISFWGPGNANSVTPNFQVFKDGSIDQMLPFGQQPWCQIAGNFNYAAIETAGLPSEPLTDAQVASIAKILRVYRDEHGMVLQLANQPGEKGFGTHEMGGVAWGGHPCPGTIRAGQRKQILALAASNTTTVDPLEEIMGWYTSKDEFEAAVSGAVAQRQIAPTSKAHPDGVTLAGGIRELIRQTDPTQVLDAIKAELANVQVDAPTKAAIEAAAARGVRAAFAKAAAA